MRKCRMAVGEVLRLYRYVFIKGTGLVICNTVSRFCMKAPTLCRPYYISLYRNFYAGREGKAHGCRIAQRFSAQRAPYERRPRTPRIFDRCHLFCPWGRVFISCVCVCVSEKWASSLGLITLTHLVAFVVAWFQSQSAARPCRVCF